MTVRVPESFSQATTEREGAAGAEWLRDLPGIVEELLDMWQCVLDGPVSHGWVGLIVPVLRADGQPAVIKVSYRHEGNVHEPVALAAWRGNGAVRLYERADHVYAMLLERVQPISLDADRDVDRVMGVAGELNFRLAVPAPVEALPLQGRAALWAQELSRDVREFRGSLDVSVTDMARETIRDLGEHQPATLIHGDFHPGNILRADREPWLAIDPKGFAGDPGYDAAVMVRWRAMALLEEGGRQTDQAHAAVMRALRVYSEAAQVDMDAALRWSQLLLVQASFWGRRHGFETARGGTRLAQAIELADELAHTLRFPQVRTKPTPVHG